MKEQERLTVELRPFVVLTDQQRSSCTHSLNLAEPAALELRDTGLLVQSVRRSSVDLGKIVSGNLPGSKVSDVRAMQVIVVEVWSLQQFLI